MKTGTEPTKSGHRDIRMDSLPALEDIIKNAPDDVVHDTSMELLSEALLAPARDILSRGSKSIRASLVEAGFQFARQSLTKLDADTADNLTRCKQAIEVLHAGSLIIDDIQDNSPVRRGSPSIHCKYGVPASIATGNWMYFWPLRILRSTNLPTADRFRLIERFTDCLEYAHYGQSLDVSIKMDELPQNKVAEVCHWVTTHKTGVLTSLAMQLGAICAGASDDLLKGISDFGFQFGRCLQNYDDLGNFYGYVDEEKQWEDLRDRSPSWIWVCAAENYRHHEYRKFVVAVRQIPERAPLEQWSAENDFVSLLNKMTDRELVSAMSELSTLPNSQKAKSIINQLAETLRNAYTSKSA